MTSLHSTFSSMLLPGAHDTALLQACLLDRDHCKQGWRACLVDEPDPFRAAGSNRRLQTLLYYNLRRNRVGLSRGLRVQLASAYVREELRWNRLRDVFDRVVDCLHSKPLVVKGPVLAETVYPVPWTRHCHDLDFIFETVEELGENRRRLTEERWLDGARLCHPSGLPLVLHTGTAAPPIYRIEADRQQRIDHVGAQTLTLSQQFLTVLLHGLSSSSRDHWIWLCDAFFLTHHPEFSWQELSNEEVEANALPLLLCLEFLQSKLNVPVPSSLLDQLGRAKVRRVDRNFATWAAGRRGGVRAALHGLELLPRLRLTFEYLFATREFLAWIHPKTPSLLRLPRHVAVLVG